MKLKITQYSLILLFVFNACKKPEDSLNNVPKSYEDVPTVKVENYINRLYIDILGREPLDNEVVRDLKYLRDEKLSIASRKVLILRLMNDTVYVVGDSSYKRAYYQRLYDLSKARLLEGASEDDFYQQISNARFAVTVSRLNGDSIGVFSAMATIDRCLNVINSRMEYQYGKIGIGEMIARMLDNPIYDVINMNSLNFVNASFDDLFFRFPSRDEFKIGFEIIENGKGGVLFEGYADNKPDYCQTLVNSREFHEGMIKWAYLSLMGREPNTTETNNLIIPFYKDKNFQFVQLNILATDEYAHF